MHAWIAGNSPKETYIDLFKNPIGGIDFAPVQNWSRFLQPAYKIKLVKYHEDVF